jgi:glycerol-3-phosphate O-acyltransferase
LSSLARNKLGYFFWLRRLIFLWVRTKLQPQRPREELGLKPGASVCYMMNTNSLSDLMVLDETCKREGLPRPRNAASALAAPGAAAFISLQKTGLVKVMRDEASQPHGQLLRLLEQAHADKTMEVQLVPVTVLWGRNPGRDEKSIPRLLFFDDEHAGVLQKIFIVLAQGRQNYLHFGKPISLRELADEGTTPAEAAKKVRRVIRVHFRRQRNAAMGPSLPSRQSVVAHLLKTKQVRGAIAEEARKKKITEVKAEAQAVKYAVEIVASMHYSVIRLFDLFLTWLWNKMFDGVEIRHGRRLRELEGTHEIVYLPSHRSHIDYLLLSYVLFYEGLVPPHIAAGINLDFWPVGPILRRGGAFFLRRSFGGNRLYTAVFNEYMHFLLTKGHSMEFFIEGGRSRTGRLLHPKTGMLAMVIQSFFRDSNKPVVFVPVYVGYDKVMEIRSLQSELRGKQKRKESVGQLVKARRVLKSSFGKAYVDFGEPIHLLPKLDAEQPQWREEMKDPDAKPKWLHPFVSDLAETTLTRINSSAVVSPLAIFALVILSCQQKALAEEELLYMMGKLLDAMKAAPYSRDITLPEGTPKDFLAHARRVSKIEVFEHPAGNVYHLGEAEAMQLTYYRNNVLHLVAMPAVIASFFQHNESMREDELVSGCSMLYPFLKSEFFLRWDAADIKKVILSVVESLLAQGLLFRDAGDASLRRPEVTSRDYSSLKTLGRALGHTLERYAISTALLAQHDDGTAFDRKEFETRCHLMAQRISILNGINEPEFFDKNLFKNFVDQLKAMGLAVDREEGKIAVEPRLRGVAEHSLNLLSGDIRQSIQRLGS